MARIPIGFRAPAACFATHCATALSRRDFANLVDGFARVHQFCGDFRDQFGANSQNHADPAIECPGHFFGFDIPLRLQEGHQAGLGPAVDVDHGVCSFGQGTRDVLQQATAGNVGQRVNLPAADNGQQAFHINARGFDQRVDQQNVLIEQGRAIKLPRLVRRQPAHQRVAIGMNAGTAKAQKDMTGGNPVSRQLFATFDRADTESGQIIIAGGIHPRHFGGFAPDKGASGNPAAFSDTGDDTFRNAVVELSGGEIIQEEQWFSALHDQIVDAHGDKIDPDSVMPIIINRQFDLGSDTIIGRHQQRIVVPRCLGVEEAAKAPDFCVRTWASSRFDEWPDGFYQGVSGGNRYARFGVAVGCLIAHLARLTLSGLEIQACLGKRPSVFPMAHSISTPFFAQSRRPIIWIGLAALAILLVFAAREALFAQVEGDRGIAPVMNSGDISVGGIEVDVRGKNAEEARENGWKMAQKLGWKKLGGPDMSDSQIDSMVAAIVVEKEQIGPHRYLATLGVVFDRTRAGALLGEGGPLARSAPMLLIPVLDSGGAETVFEVRNPWQKAWAEYQTGASAIDYVRPSGAGGDSLLLTYGQTGRRSRLWWTNILDQFSAADVLMAIARVERQWPGGPVKGHFTARFGPDSRYLDSFTLNAPNEAGVPAMLQTALGRFDAIYTEALKNGLLQPDPTLRAQRLEIDPVLAALIDAGRKAQAASLAPVDAVSVAVPTPTVATPAAPTKPVASFTVQFASPDGGAVDSALGSVRGTGGVQSAATTSIAIGGVSVMRVNYAGSLSELASALRARGWQVTEGQSALSIRR